jgi:hypothetical protein
VLYGVYGNDRSLKYFSKESEEKRKLGRQRCRWKKGVNYLAYNRE